MRVEGINIKHKRLIDEYVRNGGNGAKAWRTVYAAECKRYTNINTPNQSFYLYVRKPRIKAYLQRKLKRMVKRAEITEDSLLTKLEAAYDMAHDQAKPSDMISATNAQAKLVGLLRDRVEAGPPGGFEGLENISDVLQKLGEVVGEDATLVIAQALGVLPVVPRVSKKAEQTAGQDAVDLLVSEAASDTIQ